MELQNFIDTSPDYINILKSTNLILKRFSKYGLYLLKYPSTKKAYPSFSSFYSEIRKCKRNINQSAATK